jgi:hypothetical protein
MRNQIGIPPLEPQDEGPATPAVRKPTPAADAPTHDAPAGHRKPLRYTGDDAGTTPRAAHRHAGMDPEVRDGARKADVPDVAPSFVLPLTPRDGNGPLYVGLLVGAIAVIIVVIVLMAVL